MASGNLSIALPGGGTLFLYPKPTTSRPRSRS